MFEEVIIHTEDLVSVSCNISSYLVHPSVIFQICSEFQTRRLYVLQMLSGFGIYLKLF